MKLPQIAYGLFLLALLTQKAGADVLQVGGTQPGTFPEVTDALSNAADGDVILVAPGSYDAFVVDGLGVTVVCDDPVTFGQPGFLLSAPIVVRNLQPDQQFLLRGSTSAALNLEFNGGEVWIESAQFLGPATTLGTLRVNSCASVVLIESEFGAAVIADPFYRSVPGMLATDSNITAYGTRFFAEVLGFPPSAGTGGAAAVDLRTSSLYASGCEFRGGRGAMGGEICGIECHGDNCQNGGPGGAGLSIDAASDFRSRDNLVAGGEGGPSGAFGSGFPCGSDGVAGPPIVGLTNELFGIARRVQVEAPVRVDEPTQVTVLGSPLDLTFLLVTVEPVQLSLTTPYIGELFFAPAYLLIAVGSLDVQGMTSLQLPSPALPLGLGAQVLTAQPVFFDAVNGLVSLGGPSRGVFLDPTF